MLTTKTVTIPTAQFQADIDIDCADALQYIEQAGPLDKAAIFVKVLGAISDEDMEALMGFSMNSEQLKMFSSIEELVKFWRVRNHKKEWGRAHP